MTAPEPEVVIEAVGLEKTYRIYENQGRDWLKSVLLWPLGPDRFSREVEALRGVDLEVRRGEVVGIMGRNGAGKTTLLKVIGGLSRPTAGHLRVEGEVRALMSLGVGFQPQFTGRDNVIFGSLAMGIPRRQALERFDQIVSFAELWDAIDRPVQFYSSGMRARLAAAVAFQDVPEILIIDEALAAGDGYFLNKCHRRINEICTSGSTIFFVTHGSGLVKRMCSRAVIMDGGRIVEDGEPARVVALYNKMLLEAEKRARGPEDEQRAKKPAPRAGKAPQSKSRESIVTGTGRVEILELQLHDHDGKPSTVVHHGKPMELHITLRTTAPIEDAVRLTVRLYSKEGGLLLAETGSAYLDAGTGTFGTFYPARLDGTYRIVMRWPRNPLGGGAYYWDVFLSPRDSGEVFQTPDLFYVRLEHAGTFRSVSFPGKDWAVERKSILEPEAEFELTRLGGQKAGAKRKRPRRRKKRPAEKRLPRGAG